MTIQPATQPRDGEDPIILAPRGGVTALYAHTFLAVIVGLAALRLAFVHWFPTMTDDSATYLQLANNWVDHHVYALAPRTARWFRRTSERRATRPFWPE